MIAVLFVMIETLVNSGETSTYTIDVKRNGALEKTVSLKI
jgi:hypothetical protein